MALISLQDISLAFGDQIIFDRLNLQIENGERIALLGRNGAGKSTLMKVMANQFSVDNGEILYQKGVRITHLPQEVPNGITGLVFDVVASGLGKQAELLSQYHSVSHLLHTSQTPELLRRLDDLQSEIEHSNAWDTNNQVETIISRLGIDPDSEFEKLSGGQKRRVLLAKTLVLKPDLLLLDEPTNHLDIDSISWLEGFLKDYPGTVFFVTHDRMFMSGLATRIIELDRGKIYSWQCDYKTFLVRKESALAAEAAQNQVFNKKLAQEEEWIRQGVKARRCRSEGRVKALEKLRQEKKLQRKEIGDIEITQQKTGASGHLVSKLSHISFNYEEKCLINDFSTQIMRGDKIGVIGPNGSGKTTLLKIILGQLHPTKGKAKLGTNLEIAYYDQMRQQLDETKTAAQNICGESDIIMINGRAKHVIGYLQDFLFAPDRARSPIKVFSGGERNRLMLAKLFTLPSNLLVMDEPTNDLDIETLELLEELLMEYKGTLILVSHDRAFLNNVVTSTMALEGKGVIHELAGGYDDWINQKKAAAPEKNKSNKEIIRPKTQAPAKKLSFNQQREINSFPALIEKMEAEQKEIFALLSDQNFYKKNPGDIAKVKARSEFLAGELKKIYERWDNLNKLLE